MYKEIAKEAETILYRLLSDVRALDASEVFIGYPEPSHYSFTSPCGQFRGNISPKVFQALSLIAKRGETVRIRLANSEEINCGVTDRAGSFVICLFWKREEARRNIVPKLRLVTEERPRPPHLLLVEDDSRYRRFLAAALREQGFRVSEAPDGAQAFEFVSLNEVDLVVSDLHMPNADGLRLVKSIRERAVKVPIVILSGENDGQIVSDLVLSGVEAFIRKDDDPAILLAWCRRLTAFWERDSAG
jgi:CheY-like chemotaxis protein